MRNHQNLLILTFIFFVSLCSRGFASEAINKSIDEKFTSPVFTLTINLTEQAKSYLKQHNETIIISASFSDTIGPNENYLGGIKKELLEPGTVVFKNINFPKENIDKLETKNYEMLINVFSGRKSSKFNLLDCELYQDRVLEFNGKNIAINCKLIASAGKIE